MARVSDIGTGEISGLGNYGNEADAGMLVRIQAKSYFQYGI